MRTRRSDRDDARPGARRQPASPFDPEPGEKVVFDTQACGQRIRVTSQRLIVGEVSLMLRSLRDIDTLELSSSLTLVQVGMHGSWPYPVFCDTRQHARSLAEAIRYAMVAGAGATRGSFAA